MVGCVHVGMGRDCVVLGCVVLGCVVGSGGDWLGLGEGRSCEEDCYVCGDTGVKCRE